MCADSGKAASLSSIRRELEEIDRSIILLVAARVDAACTAIRLRSQENGVVSDPAQEERVVARARRWAEQAGLSPILAETIFRAVVEAGKDRFTTSTARTALSVTMTPERRTGRIRVHAPATSSLA
jgi:isochorismate pyruvate lyase